MLTFRDALAFELRRERRYGAWPAGWMMYNSRMRAKCHAGAGRLQRLVRHQRANYRPAFSTMRQSTLGLK